MLLPDDAVTHLLFKVQTIQFMIYEQEQLREKNSELENKLAALTRQLDIQVSFEKIRETTMSMKRSEDLKDANLVVLQQMQKQGIAAAVCFIVIMNEENRSLELNIANSQTQSNALFKGKIDDSSVNQRMYDTWKSESKSFAIEMFGEELNNYRDYLKGLGIHMHSENPANQRVFSMASFSKGIMGVASNEPLPPETMRLLEKFAHVFDGTYIRFLDLQKAEAQALKAQNDLIEIKVARKKAEQALSELQAVQSQLIQSEKMAFLGELTAGIAHEIQNPLNFVNNFSEVSNELIDEMKEELEKGDINEAKTIAADVKQNLEKIVHHGKRADAIVKGMLQHSRKSTGQKETTDINSLTDEYLRLSYHGLRAKDKAFNATMKTDFGGSIAKINIIPQDIGRVLLNLFNNAFYAVVEKQKEEGKQSESGKPRKSLKYEPAVSVTTKKMDGNVFIHVKDNGNGIPQNIIGKIFQPFFTTKPTGEGTGLGLSLAYNIIKAHGGQLKVQSKVNEGSEFVIQLPA